MADHLGETWNQRGNSCIQNWQLSSVEWLSGVSTAHVALCDCPSGRSVLKVSIQQGMIADEARALRHFGSSIAPAVYALDESLEAMLLERIDPGCDLSTLYPSAVEEVGAWLVLYRNIVNRSEIPSGFPSLADFASTFDGALAMTLPSQVRRLMQISSDHREVLMESDANNRLLHGDLHHFNILRHDDGRWRLIDPHGVVGNPLYELGAFLRNPWPNCFREPGVSDRLEERIALLANALGVPFRTVALFGFFGASISIAWTLEDEGTDYEGMVLMAEASARLAGL